MDTGAAKTTVRNYDGNVNLVGLFMVGLRWGARRQARLLWRIQKQKEDGLAICEWCQKGKKAYLRETRGKNVPRSGYEPGLREIKTSTRLLN